MPRKQWSRLRTALFKLRNNPAIAVVQFRINHDIFAVLWPTFQKIHSEWMVQIFIVDDDVHVILQESDILTNFFFSGGYRTYSFSYVSLFVWNIS